MLCEFAHQFPDFLADILDRDKGLKRNFREETATDLLTAGLVPLQSYGVTVQLPPDEKATGGDMDWIYAAPHDVGGGSYLRLIIQAKRAKFAKLKSDGYWYYHHLDDGEPKGSQAETLVSYAASSPDAMATLGLYFFYHPRSAITASIPMRPNIEGLNFVFADDVLKVVEGGCSRAEKKVGTWRKHFMPLHELLCWPMSIAPSPPPPPRLGSAEFLQDGVFTTAFFPTLLWHPDFVADRLNGLRRREIFPPTKSEDAAPPTIEPSQGIPEEIQRAIDGKTTDEERKKLERPRVIFQTSMNRESPTFQADRSALRNRQPRQG